MKFVTICARGEGLPIAMRLQDEGHNSRLLCADGSEVGQGLVDVLEMRPGQNIPQAVSYQVPKDAMLVFTSARFGEVADILQRRGYFTFGASKFHQMMQLDPGYTAAMNALYEIPTVPRELTGAFAIEAWFSGEEFIYPLFGLFPEYGFMPGDLGPVTECAGVTGFPFKNFRVPRFSATLEKLRPALRKVDYRGPISADIMGDAVLQYTCGMRMDFIYLFMQLIDQPFGRLLAEIARGMVKNFRANFSYGVCVRATMPPYPHVQLIPQPLSIASVQDLASGMLPTGLRREEERLLLASHTGDAFCVCGLGSTIKDAQTAAYQRLGKFVVPNLQARIDIAGVALRNIHLLLQSETGGRNDGDGGRDGAERVRGGAVARRGAEARASTGGGQVLSDEPGSVPERESSSRGTH